jgi:uncharacterized protein YbaP (TraB family)
LRSSSLSALLALVATLLLPAVVRAEEEKKPEPAKQPWLWVAEGDGAKLYLFGTIHLPHEKVRTLPPVVTQALAAADTLFVEVKPSELQTPEFQQRLLLPAGKTLADVVPAPVMERLRTFLEGKGVPPGVFARFRPWAVSVNLPLLDHLQVMAVHQPMDLAIYAGAEKAGQEVGALETAAEQLSVFESQSDEKQAKGLETVLEKLEEARTAGRDPLLELVDAYASGDEEKVLAVVNEDAATEDDDAKAVRKLLLDDRNVRMVDRSLAEAKKRPGKTLFVAVGLAHQLGPKGMVKLLEAKGFTVRRVGAAETIAPKAKAPVPTPVPAGK